jgi:hypothetical protein
MFYFLSLYQQFVLGYSPLKTGVGYLTVSLVIIVSAAGSQALVTRVGVRPILTLGLVLLVLGMLWFTQIDTDGSYVVDLLPGYILAGVGLGFAFVPNTIAYTVGRLERLASRDRLRADQHLAADRRRARRRHSHLRRRDANREPRPSGRPGRAHERLPLCVRRRRRNGAHRRRRGDHDDTHVADPRGPGRCPDSQRLRWPRLPTPLRASSSGRRTRSSRG